jgi:hypothetical protein
MIGDTVSVTFNGVAKTLRKINQDNYSSEYQLRTSTEEFVLRIRHQKESLVAGKPQFERHHVDLTRVEFDAVNGDRTFQSYTVIRLQRGNDPVNARHLTLALNGFEVAATLDQIIGWES